MAKAKKIVKAGENLRNRTKEMLKKMNISKQINFSEEIIENIENGIDSVSKDENTYSVLTIKVLQNLNNETVIKNILEGKWNAEDLVKLEKETLNPEKWQKLQEKRLPKSKKERRKGTNMCPRCKSWYTTYKQAQTRSGDEGLTTRCYCEDCEYHWKFG